MKTPHTIELFEDLGVPKFNPILGEYKPSEGTSKKFPCLVNFMSKEKQFEEYGSRENEIIVVRFNTDVPEFRKARYKGKTYMRFGESFVPRKRSFRLQKVADEQ